MTMPKDADAQLLCESCGYGLAGISRAMPCPECGVAVTESLPEKRIGTRWQRRPGLSGWARTNWDVLRHPRVTYRLMSVVPTGWRVLLIVNIVIAAFLLVEPWTGTFIGDPLRHVHAMDNPRIVALYAVSLIARTAVVGVLLFGLTWIEARGLRFIAGKRGWRVGKDAAWQICAHASVGWIVLALLPLLTLATLFTVSSFFGTAWSSWSGKTLNVSYFNRFMSAGELVSLVATAVAYLAGLIVFESLVYVGVRRCCYANIGSSAVATAEGVAVTSTAPPAA